MKVPEIFKKPITLLHVEGVVVLTPLRTCCPLRAAVFIGRNHRRWVNHNTLWNMSDYDFSQLNYANISKFTGQVQKLAKKRNNLKTAILISSTTGQGVARMFQTLLGGWETGLNVQAFYDRNEAMDWLQE